MKILKSHDFGVDISFVNSLQWIYNNQYYKVPERQGFVIANFEDETNSWEVNSFTQLKFFENLSAFSKPVTNKKLCVLRAYKELGREYMRHNGYKD